MADKPYWSVTVSINGDSALTIEPHMLSGIENISDYAEEVREAARHLLAFIGDGTEGTFDQDAALTPSPTGR